ncbi:hypothetical protein AAVH_08163 [Aphelenchoides avenae]|nr:hypothetical protein AAVH_08163 [Aphelenchus avenae]
MYPNLRQETASDGYDHDEDPEDMRGSKEKLLALPSKPVTPAANPSTSDWWQTLHVYNEKALWLTSNTQRITAEDRTTELYEARIKRPWFYTKKPRVVLRRSNSDYVGACRMRSTWFRGVKLKFYLDEECSFLVATMMRDGVFTNRHILTVHASRSCLYWKHTSHSGGSFLGDNYKLVDEGDNVLAVLQDVMSMKKEGRLQIRVGLDPATVDLIVLTAVSLAEKLKLERD